MKRIVFSILLLFAMAPLATAEPVIFVVRHAEKAETSGGDPKDPELSEAGRARAELLARMLHDAPLTAMYATEFKRSQQTADPVARAAGVDVSVVPAQETDTLVARLLNGQGNALVVAHSNTIPAIIKALGVESAVSVGEMDYDNLFVILRDPQPRILRLHY